MANQHFESDSFDTIIPPLPYLDDSDQDNSCYLDGFHFTNVDVKVANGDAYIILSADEVDDIVITSSLLHESRYFDQAFSGNWKVGVKKIKSPNTKKVVKIRRWTMQSVWEAEGGNKGAKLYLLQGGVCFKSLGCFHHSLI